MEKVLIFYKYVDILYPKQIYKWQKELCNKLSIKGRIIIAHEGINATIAGIEENLQKYINYMSEHPLFGEIDFKESKGSIDCFAKLSILVKDEIVKLNLDTKVINAKNSGKHLEPSEVHKLIESNQRDLVIFDARNNYESAIGAFTNSIKPNIRYFRELPKFIENNAEIFKDKQVLMYCTAGIRCERASAFLKTKNLAKEVYQIKGGIHRYIEQYPDGFFRGKNYVFDARITVKVNEDVLGQCYICNIAYDEYTNCRNAECNRHFISCNDCLDKYQNSCGSICLDLILNNRVHLRPDFKKVKI